MSALFDRIIAVLREHSSLDDDEWDRCECGAPTDGDWAAHTVQQIAKVIQPTLTTQEHLDALPHLSLVLYQYVSRAGWKLHEVWERRNESWYCLAAPTNPPGREFGFPPLPALLLWTGEDGDE